MSDSKTNEPTTTSAPDYRRIEKLIAAYHYEFAPDPNTGHYRGCCSEELLGDLFDEAREIVLNGDTWAKNPEEPTPAEMQRLDEQCVAFGEHMIRGLAAIGYIEQAEAFIERIALRRAECDAKFSAPRDIPFSADERERLAKSWGSATDEAEVAELDRKLAHAAATIGGAS